MEKSVRKENKQIPILLSYHQECSIIIPFGIAPMGKIKAALSLMSVGLQCRDKNYVDGN